MRLRYTIGVIVLTSLAVFGMACGGQGEKQSLARHRDLWAGQGVASYQYQLKVNCFCPPEVTDQVIVVVRDGVSEVTYVANGEPADSKHFGKYDTVGELFSVIDDALTRKPGEISITYDESLGFPASIRIDFVKQAADDEIAYTVSEFQTL